MAGADTRHLLAGLPGADSEAAMWSILEELFPLYRALCGPDFADSLARLGRRLPLEVTGIPSGTPLPGGWRVPDEFTVRAAHVDTPDGRRILDFAEHPYHLFIYSRPFTGVLSREELLARVATHPALPGAIPLRQSYYRDTWGLCARAAEIADLPEGDYRVTIDTGLTPGALRIGECVLPGEDAREILITTYLCHPRGANDNLSGVAVAVELFRQLALLPRRRFTYRLAIWPETIGALAWIHHRPEVVARLAGGYEISICGDASPVRYYASLAGDGLADRAALHALEHTGNAVGAVPFSNFFSGSDQCHFNGVGLRVPFGRWGRSGAGTEGYPQYHSSEDDLTVVRPAHLLDTLQVVWAAVMAMERAVTYGADFIGTPFLSGYGIFPYAHGAGDGRPGDAIARTYYEMMALVDRDRDMIDVARYCGLPVWLFDEAVADFTRVGLIHPAG